MYLESTLLTLLLLQYPAHPTCSHTLYLYPTCSHTLYLYPTRSHTLYLYPTCSHTLYLYPHLLPHTVSLPPPAPTHCISTPTPHNIYLPQPAPTHFISTPPAPTHCISTPTPHNIYLPPPHKLLIPHPKHYQYPHHIHSISTPPPFPSHTWSHCTVLNNNNSINIQVYFKLNMTFLAYTYRCLEFITLPCRQYID